MHRTSIVLFSMLWLMACAQPKADNKTAQTETPATTASDARTVSSTLKTWKELDDFHAVMAETYHPLEDGDFKPIRQRANELAARAKDWAASAVPENYTTKPEFKAVMDSLVKESQALAEMIAKNASDQEVKAALTALHDRFHQVEGMCQRKK
jgi:hypothetical protein